MKIEAKRIEIEADSGRSRWILVAFSPIYNPISFSSWCPATDVFQRRLLLSEGRKWRFDIGIVTDNNNGYKALYHEIILKNV
ncbi:MAG: hypothetical protein NC453_08895 [Muribaculum sp.]|nr:hypothetical protein [Muribaculum sp.]